MNTKTKACLHCGRRGAWRRRRLCSPCYYKPSIRRQYPAGPGGGDLATGRDFYGPAKRPRGAACECMPPLIGLPGSEDRILELERRFARQYNLFAEDDYVRQPAGRNGPRVATMAVDDEWPQFADDPWVDDGD